MDLLEIIPVAQTINGDRIHETRTTKEIASILGITTKKAYKILCEMESNGNACKCGYKTKDGFEDHNSRRLSTNSLTWQLIS